jgi:DMSO/TMAO reductase YedYZ molybdopterin-dependent catalytic subunit
MADENDPPPISKLTRTKQRWAREGRFLTGKTSRPEEQRLPPGQHLTKDWPTLDLGLTPEISRERWRLDVYGAVENPIFWNFAQFTAQPQTQFMSDIHCVTTWSRYDNRWEGLATRDLLNACQPRDEARHVVLHSHDGYATNLTLEDFAADDALLAHSWSGAPLAQEHGGPVQLVVPRLATDFACESVELPTKLPTLVLRECPGIAANYSPLSALQSDGRVIDRRQFYSLATGKSALF